MIKIGLIVNPIAGLGGSVGLKGTDGMEEEALRLGAKPLSNIRAAAALRELKALDESLTVCTGGGALGADIAAALGLKTEILYNVSGLSSANDTVALAKILSAAAIPLILFAGGDGTARDIFYAVGPDIPVLGIPAGVKIYSPVYAKTPKAAGLLASNYLSGKVRNTTQAEVLDIDEDLYRKGHVDVKLCGYLSVPQDKNFMQGRKAASPISEEAAMDAIAGVMIREMQPDTYYLIGAGTTTRRIMDCLQLSGTLIGVDLILNKKLVASDVYGENILNIVGDHPLKLIVTITGGQGFLFGRGNQQLTPSVLAKVGKDNIIIIATQKKLASLGGQSLLLDTGEDSIDAMLSGYYKITTGYHQSVVAKAE